jgi:hypothetical protein
MVNKKIILIFILCLIFLNCREFKGEKLEINYKKGYVKILSSEYVIDSLIVDNHIEKYFIISLSDKSKGNNIIYFKAKNIDYKIHQDSLEYYCSKIPDVDSPGLEVFIRKKGYIGSDLGDDFKNIESFGYNQTPCKHTILDTIEARNPYK